MSTLAEITNHLDMCIPLLEKTIPQIINHNEFEMALKRLEEVAVSLQNQTLAAIDPAINKIGSLLKILINGSSPALGTNAFQMYILELLEELQKVYNQIASGVEPSGNFNSMKEVGEFFLRYADRLMIRYKLRVEFEPDYDGKYLRAFQVLKELHNYCKFLMVTPDISKNPKVDLNNGLDIEVLSQETPMKLHEIASGVLEVKSVQVFSEQKNTVVLHLDPPDVEGSYDHVYQQFLT